jgi:hypothetical protein
MSHTATDRLYSIRSCRSLGTGPRNRSFYKLRYPKFKYILNAVRPDVLFDSQVMEIMQTNT